MSDSTPHSIAEQILDGVTLPDYPELADLARAYVGLEERYEQMRGFRDECERQYQAKLDEVNGLIEQYQAALDALRDYAQHASWRCEYRSRYGKCICGLDDAMERFGLPPVGVIDPEAKASNPASGSSDE